MMRAVNQEDMWKTLFQEQNEVLTFVADALSQPHASSPHILNKALTALEGSPFRDTFGQVCGIRAVVKAAIENNREPSNSGAEAESLGPERCGFSENSSLSVLPWPERAVYFLRKALRYSRRDTALLLGTSDDNIDRLLEFAEKRIALASRAASFPADVSVRSDRCIATGLRQALA